MRSIGWVLASSAALFFAACGGYDGRQRDWEIDADGDGVTANLDCNDADPAGYAQVIGYTDEDGDGFGEEGKASGYCGIPGAPRAGESFQAGDCAPRDPLAWRSVDRVDRDGDGFTTKEATAICGGAILPEPYREVAAGNDCDDADPAVFIWTVLYPDRDGDGVGGQPRSITCIGVAVPSGWSRIGYDPNDLDMAVVSDPSADDLARLLD